MLLISHRASRVLIGDRDHLVEVTSVLDDVHGRHAQGGWSQARYQRGIEKETDDHIRRTCEALFERLKRRPFDRLLIGGPSELHKRVIRRASLGPAGAPGRRVRDRCRARHRRRGRRALLGADRCRGEAPGGVRSAQAARGARARRPFCGGPRGGARVAERAARGGAAPGPRLQRARFRLPGLRPAHARWRPVPARRVSAAGPGGRRRERDRARDRAGGGGPGPAPERRGPRRAGLRRRASARTSCSAWPTEASSEPHQRRLRRAVLGGRASARARPAASPR